MKSAFVQCAEIQLEPSADPAAPGGAVTMQLCGSWDHPGPCRWPHQTSAEWDGICGRVRVVFAAPEEEEAEVRRLIERALARGECVGPDGTRSQWTASAHAAGTLTVSEQKLSEQWRLGAT